MNDKEHGDGVGEQMLAIFEHCHETGNFRIDSLDKGLQTFLHDHLSIKLQLYHIDPNVRSGGEYLKPDAYLAYLGYLNQLDALESAKQSGRSARSAVLAAWVAVGVAVAVGLVTLGGFVVSLLAFMRAA